MVTPYRFINLLTREIMKNFKLIALFAVVTIATQGCTSALYQTSSGIWADDLYGVHNQNAIYQAQTAKAEARTAEAQARKAEAEALIAEWQALQTGSEVYSKTDNDTKYSALLSKFDDNVYILPDSYYNLSASGGEIYTSAYDPASSTTIIVTDDLYVAPMYASSMFGYWAPRSYFNYGYYSPYWRHNWYYDTYYGYNHHSWGYWNWNFCYRPYYDPWYYPTLRPYHPHHHYWGYANKYSNRDYYRTSRGSSSISSSSRPSRYVAGATSSRGSRAVTTTRGTSTRATLTRGTTNRGTASSYISPTTTTAQRSISDSRSSATRGGSTAERRENLRQELSSPTTTTGGSRYSRTVSRPSSESKVSTSSREREPRSSSSYRSSGSSSRSRSSSRSSSSSSSYSTQSHSRSSSSYSPSRSSSSYSPSRGSSYSGGSRGGSSSSRSSSSSTRSR